MVGGGGGSGGSSGEERAIESSGHANSARSKWNERTVLSVKGWRTQHMLGVR